MRDKRSWSHTRSLALARATEKEEGVFDFISKMVFSAFLCDSVRDKGFMLFYSTEGISAREKRSQSHTRSPKLARATEKEEGVFDFISKMVFSAFLCDSVRDKFFVFLLFYSTGVTLRDTK